METPPGGDITEIRTLPPLEGGIGRVATMSYSGVLSIWHLGGNHGVAHLIGGPTETTDIANLTEPVRVAATYKEGVVCWDMSKLDDCLVETVTVGESDAKPYQVLKHRLKSQP